MISRSSIRDTFYQVAHTLLVVKNLSKSRDPEGKLFRSSLPKKQLLFLCKGNICRSPYAEFRARELLGSEWVVRSAGLETTPGRSADPTAIIASKKLGIDLTPHRTQSVDGSMVRDATWVVVMEVGQLCQTVSRFPEATRRTLQLGYFHTPSKTRLTDPYGREEKFFLDRYREIDLALDGLLKMIRTAEAV